MSAQNNTTNLPQGFSVFQPYLGAPLQFFPPVGTVELDDLVNSFIPGPLAITEKRATVALDFCEYVQLTGENFKFYPVYTVTPMDSPVTASPLQDSSSGSYNASPVMSNWDWSQVSAAASKTSNPSRQRRSSPKTAIPRHPTTDFSHLPGMKIMTKDGRDVTNSASRGSKTKEQRDHAHLMRIIKACDTCRRKKVRCDPSHKKRGASQSQPQSAAKTAKKMKAVVQEVRAIAQPVIVEDQLTTAIASFVADTSFAATGLEGLDPPSTFTESWEEFVSYPAESIPEDYDFFNDPEGHLSPQSFSSFSASSSSLPSTSSLPGAPNAPSAGLSPSLNTDRSSDLCSDRSPDGSLDLSLDLSPTQSPYRDPGLDGSLDTVLEPCYYSSLDTTSDSSLNTGAARIDYSEFVGINHSRIDHIIESTVRRDIVNVDDQAYAQTEYTDYVNVQSPSNVAPNDSGIEAYASETIAQNCTDAESGNRSGGSEVIANVGIARINHNNGIAIGDAYQLTEGDRNACSASSSTTRLTHTGAVEQSQLLVSSSTRTTTTRTTTTVTTEKTKDVIESSDSAQILRAIFVLALASANYNAATWLVTIFAAVLVLVAFQGCLQLLSWPQGQQESTRMTTHECTKQQSSHAHILSGSTGKLGALQGLSSSVTKLGCRIMMSQGQLLVSA